MAGMMGKYRYWGFYCECCNAPLRNKQVRAREKRAWRRDFDAVR